MTSDCWQPDGAQQTLSGCPCLVVVLQILAFQFSKFQFQISIYVTIDSLLVPSKHLGGVPSSGSCYLLFQLQQPIAQLLYILQISQIKYTASTNFDIHLQSTAISSKNLKEKDMLDIYIDILLNKTLLVCPNWRSYVDDLYTSIASLPKQSMASFQCV